MHVSVPADALDAIAFRKATVQTLWNRRFEQMAKKIYVGNLSFQVTDKDLTDLFAEFGTVESAQIITDRDTGRSKGFGFVEMTDDEAAGKAIQRLNGKEVKGRALTVNEARPPERKDRGGYRRR
jgi:cold-inducible RNA-binding protein